MDTESGGEDHSLPVIGRVNPRSFLCCGFGIGLVLSLAGCSAVRVVPAAHLGVVTTFGAVSHDVLDSGMHFTSPFAVVTPISTRTTLHEQTNFVPTKEGLNVKLDAAILFHVEKDRVRDLYLAFLGNHVNQLIEPTMQSAVRDMTGDVEAQALYNSSRTELQQQLKNSLAANFTARGITIETALLKEVVLPASLQQSIQEKTKAQQEALQMKFTLLKEEQEAQRKRIEAGGVAAFQKIVSDGISPNLLKWKGIEATEKFSESDNQKIVVMGNSQASLPVMFSGDVTA